MDPLTLALGSDHAGFELKERLKAFLRERGECFQDFGPPNGEPVDYPDYGIQVAQAISEGRYQRGILVCGTGIGMSIVANKFRGVRGALCHDLYTARHAKAHTNANLLILGGRVVGEGLAREIVATWLDVKFEGGRHERRLEKIAQLEEEMLSP